MPPPGDPLHRLYASWESNLLRIILEDPEPLCAGGFGEDGVESALETAVLHSKAVTSRRFLVSRSQFWKWWETISPVQGDSATSKAPPTLSGGRTLSFQHPRQARGQAP